MKTYINLGLSLAAGAVIGFISWRIGGDLFAVPLVIALWAISTSRIAAFSVMFGYYMAGSRIIPSAAAVFFGEANSLSLGILLWIASSMLLALAWAWAWPKLGAGLARTVLAPLMALILVTLPPVGIFGWMNPVLASGWYFPGSGTLGLIALSAIYIAMTVSAKYYGQPRWVVFICLGLLVPMAFNLLQKTNPSSHPEWAALNTQLGKIPSDVDGIALRQAQLIELTQAALASGAKVVILPEQSAGRWSRENFFVWESLLKKTLIEKDAVVLIGAEVPNGTHYLNALVAYNGEETRVFSARQPVPVSMWKPYASDGALIDWFKLGGAKIYGKKLAISFCYEDYLTWPILTTIAVIKPDFIVSVANGWWVKGSAANAIQFMHIDAWSRLYGVPLLRATNT